MGKANTAVDLYLPTYDYDKYPNRDWLCNLLNSLEHPKFQKLITDSLKDREKMLMLRKKMNVVAIPEIRNIFIKSQNVSLSKGKSHFLLRDSQVGRKRRHPEVEMKVDNDHFHKIEKLQATIESLESKLSEYQSIQEDLLIDRGKLVKLYQDGIVDSDGEYKQL